MLWHVECPQKILQKIIYDPFILLYIIRVYSYSIIIFCIPNRFHKELEKFYDIDIVNSNHLLDLGCHFYKYWYMGV